MHADKFLNFIKSGRTPFKKLPVPVMARIASLTEGLYPDSICVAIERLQMHAAIIAVCMAALLVPAFGMYSEPWSTSTFLGWVAFSAGCIGLASFYLYIVHRQKQNPIAPGIYLTRTHLLKLSSNICHHYWLRDLREIRVAHNFSEQVSRRTYKLVSFRPRYLFKNGVMTADFPEKSAFESYRDGEYENTTLTFDFGGNSVHATVSDIKEMELAVGYLERTQAEIQELVDKSEWEKLYHENILKGAETPNYHLWRPSRFEGRDRKHLVLTLAAVVLVAAGFRFGNLILSEFYAWNRIVAEPTVEECKNYLAFSTIGVMSGRAQELGWELAKNDTTFLSLREYLAGSFKMKYHEQAKDSMRARYEKAKWRLLARHTYTTMDSTQSAFLQVVSAWLERAKNSGDPVVRVRFEPRSEIPSDWTESLRTLTGLTIRGGMEESFDSTSNRERHASVLESFARALATQIPETALELVQVKDGGSDLDIRYTIIPGALMYTADQSKLPEKAREYIPGIQIAWKLHAPNPEQARAFDDEFLSESRDYFKSESFFTYDALSLEAFGALERHLRFLLRN